MKKLTAGIFVLLLTVVSVGAANVNIASQGYVDEKVGAISVDIGVSVDGTGNVITNVSASGNTINATKGITAEETTNKVTNVRDVTTATDIAYPSEKAVATSLAKKLENTATGTGSLSTGGATPATADHTVVIGDAASGSTASVVVGKSAKSSETGFMNVAVGMNASANDREAVAIGSNANVAGQGVAIGANAKSTVGSGTAVGFTAEAGAGSAVAIGQNAKSTALGAIQLGSGTNSTEGTFNVGFGSNKNYQLLDNDGKIPDERMPDTVLTNTATGTDSFAVGNNSGASGNDSVVIGARAFTRGANNVVVGNGAQVGGTYSVSLGFGASSNAENAIQIGTGNNNDSGTLSVGFGDSGNYKLLDANGKIPGERLQISVGDPEGTGGYADIWIE